MNNIRNIPIASGTKWDDYETHLKMNAVPFLLEFKPQLLIVSAGYG
jgi:acetoin utilization deacetylase AcuC-like enzyme